MGKINYFTEDIDFDVPTPVKTKSWLLKSVLSEKSSVREVNYIFCSDDYLLSINRRYLNHRTLTDIVTFDNSDGGGALEGDIFISVDRVRENSLRFNVSFSVELHRVMIHGILHLLGYNDKTPKHRAQMRKKEDQYLSLWA
jgi:probable rRNA maturation factor